MKKSSLYIILVCVLLLTSCSEYAKQTDSTSKYSTGVVVTPDIISSYKESFIEASKTEPPPEFDENSVFYWTKSGGKLHIYSDCQTLKRTDEDNIMSGNHAAMIAANAKTDVCSYCRKRAGLSDDYVLVIKPVDSTSHSDQQETTISPDDNNTETSKHPETTAETSLAESTDKPVFDENTKFFWTKSGTKLHFYNDCQSLRRTDEANILSGNYAAAVSAQKSSPCSYCLKRAGIEEKDFTVVTSASK